MLRTKNLPAFVLLGIGLSYSLFCSAATPTIPYVHSAATQANKQPPLLECSRVSMRVFGGLITIGEASLHLNRCDQAKQVLQDIAKQFTIDLSRNASAERLRAMAERLIDDNLRTDEDQNPNLRFECITQAYIDAKEGSRYDVRYRPEEGLTLWLDGERLSQCPPDADLADYFAIWFGEEPFNQKLKRRLLNQALEQ